MRREFGKHFLNAGLLFLGGTLIQPWVQGHFDSRVALLGGTLYVLSLSIGGLLLKEARDA